MKLETSVLFKKNLAHKENIRQLTAGELKRVQEILFGILCAVDEVCKKKIYHTVSVGDLRWEPSDIVILFRGMMIWIFIY